MRFAVLVPHIDERVAALQMHLQLCSAAFFGSRVLKGQDQQREAGDLDCLGVDVRAKDIVAEDTDLLGGCKPPGAVRRARERLRVTARFMAHVPGAMPGEHVLERPQDKRSGATSGIQDAQMGNLLGRPPAAQPADRSADDEFHNVRGRVENPGRAPSLRRVLHDDAFARLSAGDPGQQLFVCLTENLDWQVGLVGAKDALLPRFASDRQNARDCRAAQTAGALDRRKQLARIVYSSTRTKTKHE